jgi:hypothetical protein
MQNKNNLTPDDVDDFKEEIIEIYQALVQCIDNLLEKKDLRKRCIFTAFLEGALMTGISCEWPSEMMRALLNYACDSYEKKVMKMEKKKDA